MTSLFLATAGGHLRQLHELSRRLPGADDALWATTADQQSHSLLEGREVVYVPDVRPRRPLDAVRSLPRAHRLRSVKDISRVFSTGSGIALGYLPYLAARGIPCHYIESATRVSGPSVTGRVLQRTPRVRLYAQYRDWARGRWGYGGNIFDAYEPAVAAAGVDGELRVVVTVGIATGFPFRRLLERLVTMLAPGGELHRRTGRRVRVLWQTAGTPTDGLPIAARPYVPADELSAALEDAHVVISHAGTGTAVAALEAGRSPLLVPREAAFGEIADDHQTQLATELDRRGLARSRAVDDLTVEDLIATMATRTRRSPRPAPFELAL